MVKHVSVSGFAHRSVVAAVVGVFLFAASAQGTGSIGLNWDGGWYSGPFPLAANDNTGAYAQVNWDNERTGAYQNAKWYTTPFLKDNTAAPTTLKITVGNPTQNQLQDDGPGPGNNTGGIQTLFYGQIRCNTDGGPCWVSSTGMPYSTYDLYVYTNSGITVTAGGGSGSTSISGFGIGSGYVEGQNYIKRTGMSGDFGFTDGGTIYAIQVVEGGAPPVPQLTADPLSGSTLDFGKLGTSKPATSSTLTLSNTGEVGSTINVSAADITGPGGSLFAITGGFTPASLAGQGAGANYSVNFLGAATSGAYDAVVTFVDDLAGTPDATYNLHAVVLHPGDANGDGVVDLQDFGLLKDNFGMTQGATWAMGDFTGDYAIDLQDFGILKDHFGHTTGSNPITAVPEPATIALLALSGLAVLRGKRK